MASFLETAERATPSMAPSPPQPPDDAPAPPRQRSPGREVVRLSCRRRLVSGSERGSVETQVEDLRHPGEIDVMGKDRRVVAGRDGGDHAVNQAAGSHPCSSARPVDPYRTVKVDDRIKRDPIEPQQ